MTGKHAKNRAPSAAKRWLSCPYSAYITPMYPNDDTEASLKGDLWHSLMEDMVTFGTLPDDTDPAAYEAMEDLFGYVQRRVREMGGPGKVKIYVEQHLDIPETGEFGTADIILVSDREIEIIDEKSGYVVVGIRMNPQLLVYLLGAMAKFGERKKYTLTVHQPNYDHIDGAIRSFEPTDEDIAWIRNEIRYSIENDERCVAGKHCKETYCPHRGACAPFMDYVQKDLILGWHSSEVKAIDDQALATALDASDELGGWRNELRSEAMRRILNHGRTIHGYKVVKGRKQRAVLNPAELVSSVYEHMGEEWACMLFPGLGWVDTPKLVSELRNEEVLKLLGTAKHIEDVIKQYARRYRLPRGGWKQIYDNIVGPYIRETAEGLSLERAIDGRPAHKRGNEFGPLLNLDPSTGTLNII